jgi:hypothetical protein
VAINPLLSLATSRVVELQRGLGDEKRRQDSAASFLSRPFGAGADASASNDLAPSQDELTNIGGKGAKTGAANSDRSQRPSESVRLGQTDFLREAVSLVSNDRRSLFATVGFSAQQISQGEGDGAVPADESGKNAEAAQAYGQAQRRGDGGATPSGPQIVTESGVLFGFGAVDNISRLDLTA